MLSAGTMIGRYRLEAEVGHGGMGVVYRAWDTTQERPAALKLLSPHLTEDPQSLARFRREAASVARLEHPHIARFYEFGEQDGQTYIAAPLILSLPCGLPRPPPGARQEFVMPRRARHRRAPGAAQPGSID